MYSKICSNYFFILDCFISEVQKGIEIPYYIGFYQKKRFLMPFWNYFSTNNGNIFIFFENCKHLKCPIFFRKRIRIKIEENISFAKWYSLIPCIRKRYCLDNNILKTQIIITESFGIIFCFLIIKLIKYKYGCSYIFLLR